MGADSDGHGRQRERRMIGRISDEEEPQNEPEGAIRKGLFSYQPII